MSEYKITTDLFILPYENGRSILYAPLAGFVCEANKEMVDLLADIENLENNMLSPSILEILDLLIQKKVINSSLASPKKKYDRPFSPDQLAIFPTNACNLICSYCYAAQYSASSKTMKWEIAQGAIDYFLKLLIKRGKKTFNLEFHGGGEPFQAWNLMQDIVRYAQDQCKLKGFDFKVHSATNGVLNSDQLNWIVKHFSFILVSFDGLPQVQDYHRKKINGEGSFQQVDQTMKFFDKHNFPYGIRCAVSRYNENLLKETIDFIYQNYKTKIIFIEPVHICTGSLIRDAGLSTPDITKFIESYKQLEPICASRGIRLGYSGAIFERISTNFCHAGTDDFAVTPDGYMTNCWEVTDIAHPLASKFIFGQIHNRVVPK